MPPANPPLGLFHSEADLRLARQNLDSEPIRSALPLLSATQADPLAAAQLSVLRGQLYEDDEPGDRAAAALNQADFMLAAGKRLAGLKRALGWLSLVAMLRDHRAWNPSWRDAIATGLERFSQTDDPLRAYWLAAVTLAAGILLESDDAIERATAVYRRAVDEHIHPEGYLKGIADVVDGQRLYEAQTSATAALVLMAEMARLAGLDLWSYDSRAVTVITAVTYTHFYYFYPEKWRWQTGLTLERTRKVMEDEGAFMELVNRRSPPPGIEHFLEERRPLFCAWGGGLTTLTHGLAPPKKRRWRLW